MENKQTEKKLIKKQVGITMLVVSLVLLVFTIFRIIPGVQDFFLGVFGIMLYPILLFLLLFSIALTLNLRFVYSPKYLVYLFLCFFFFICIVHIIFTGFNSSGMNYGQYLSACYERKFTPGGLIVGLFTFPITSLLHDIAGIVIYGIALVICLYFVISYLEGVKQAKIDNPPKTRYQNFEEMSREVEFENFFSQEDTPRETPPRVEAKVIEQTSLNQETKSKEEDIFIKDEEPAPVVDEVALAKEKLGLSKKVEPEIEEKKEEPQAKLFVKEENDNSWQMRAFNNLGKPQKFVYEEKTQPEEVKKVNPAYEKDKEYLSTILNIRNENENPIINAEDYDDYKEKMRLFKERESSENIIREQQTSKRIEPKGDLNFGIEPQRSTTYIAPKQNSQISEYKTRLTSQENKFENRENKTHAPDFINESIDDIIAKDIEPDEDYIKPQSFESSSSIVKEGNIEINNMPDLRAHQDTTSQKFMEESTKQNSIEESLGSTISLTPQNRTFNLEVINGPAPQKPIEPNFSYGDYVRPPIDLLKTYINEEDKGEDVQQKIEALERVLADFGIPAKVEDVRRGAAVTRYELRMPSGVTVKKVEAHAQDITLALAAKRDVRIEAPIKGKSAVGIEVPNEKVDIVGLKDIIESPQFMNSQSPLNFALGKDVDGAIRCCNLERMPHMLVAGSTNSGKSSCLNSLLISLLYHTSPEDLRLLLVDPKQVEFNSYNNLPHLLMPTTITDMKKVMPALDWLIGEMERRYTLFRDNYVRNLQEYNALSEVKSKKKAKLPCIVLIVDEFADLIVTLNRKEFEDRIQRLTQKARAAGIHLILATQRPSVDIITGIIKANLPGKIAFAVSRMEDSKTILGRSGAENLLGRGDMLYAPNDGEPTRVQGSWVDTPEIRAVVDFIKENNPCVYDEKIAKAINNDGGVPQGGGSYNAGPGVDSLMPDALKAVIENGQASSSMLQRKFAIGFQRASKIIDQMEQAGFISGSDGSKPRTVYITMEEYNQIYSNNSGGSTNGQF